MQRFKYQYIISLVPDACLRYMINNTHVDNYTVLPVLRHPDDPISPLGSQENAATLLLSDRSINWSFRFFSGHLLSRQIGHVLIHRNIYVVEF